MHLFDAETRGSNLLFQKKNARRVDVEWCVEVASGVYVERHVQAARRHDVERRGEDKSEVTKEQPTQPAEDA